MEQQIVVYKPGEKMKMEVKKEGELEQESACAKFAHAAPQGDFTFAVQRICYNVHIRRN